LLLWVFILLPGKFFIKAEKNYMKNKIIVITLNYNQNKYTIDCIKSLLKSNYSDFSILLIDNGSTSENFIELQEYLPKDERIILKRIENNSGYVGGINYGIEKGLDLNADYFLIMNNDTIIDSNAMRYLVDTCSLYENKTIVSGIVYNYKSDIIQFIGYKLINEKFLEFKIVGRNEKDEGQYRNKIIEFEMLDDIFWLIPKQLIDEIGLYNTAFWFCSEQRDFAWRAKKINYKLIVNTNAKIEHKGSVSIGGRNLNPQLIYWSIQGQLIFNCLHLKPIIFLRTFLPVFLYALTNIAKVILLKEYRNLNGIKVSIAPFCSICYIIKWYFNKDKANNGKIPKFLTKNEI